MMKSKLMITMLSDDEEVHFKYITSFDASRNPIGDYMGFPWASL
jgi:hypothetical protein